MLLACTGAALGAVLRYLLTTLIKRRYAGWPLATLVVNLSGAFLLGLLTHHLVSGPVLTFLGTGVLGGYTTFSTFNVELLALIDDHRWRALAGDLVLSDGGGLALAALGLML